jgi:two-component system chemotaxis sensor kinase CheA
MEEFVKKYIQEANELLVLLEDNTLLLEKNSNDTSLINNIFRNFHTIKGGGAMFGFNNVSEVTHEIEVL